MNLIITTRLVRHGKAKCRACHRRRILFSLASTSDSGTGEAETPRLCSECSGIIPGNVPLGLTDVGESRRAAAIDAVRSVRTRAEELHNASDIGEERVALLAGLGEALTILEA